MCIRSLINIILKEFPYRFASKRKNYNAIILNMNNFNKILKFIHNVYITFKHEFCEINFKIVKKNMKIMEYSKIWSTP